MRHRSQALAQAQDAEFFQLTKSHREIIYTTFVYCFAIFSLSLILPFWLALLCCIAAFFIHRIFFNKSTIIALQYDQKNEWTLHDINEKTTRAKLLPYSVLWRYLFILYFEDLDNFTRQTVVLFSDSIGADQSKSLR